MDDLTLLLLDRITKAFHEWRETSPRSRTSQPSSKRKHSELTAVGMPWLLHACWHKKASIRACRLPAVYSSKRKYKLATGPHSYGNLPVSRHFSTVYSA